MLEPISLDAVIQVPGGPAEDPSDGFAYGGWAVHIPTTLLERPEKVDEYAVRPVGRAQNL